MMNLLQSGTLLGEEIQEYLIMLYRQSKITGSAQINFIAAKLGISSATAEDSAQFLQQVGLVKYEKYGRILLTNDGKQYVKSILNHGNK